MSENLEGMTPGFERFELDPVVQRGVTAAGFK
jgi:hypothetical protein